MNIYNPIFAADLIGLGVFGIVVGVGILVVIEWIRILWREWIEGREEHSER